MHRTLYLRLFHGYPKGQKLILETWASLKLFKLFIQRDGVLRSEEVLKSGIKDKGRGEMKKEGG